MDNEYLEVMNAMLKGFDIFSILEKCDIRFNDIPISIEDKKIISLYLGLINTENKFSKFVYANGFICNIQVFPKKLASYEYYELKNVKFKSFFDNVEIDTLSSVFLYAKFLLQFDIIACLNSRNKLLTGENIDKILNKHI